MDDPFFDEWFDIVKGILVNHEFQKRKLFKHHTKSVWDHSIEVSFRAFKYAYKCFADVRICSIGGLLHDFYPYAWQYSEELARYDHKYLNRLSKREPLFKRHGFSHAKEAYYNYLKYFPKYKDERISNCIIRHMFPLNIIPPKYIESWIVSVADKSVSLKDTFYIIRVLLSKEK